MHHRFPRMRDPTSAKCRAKHSAKIGRWLNLSVNFGENGLKGKRSVIELVLPIQSNSLRCADCQNFSNHFKHDYDNDDCENNDHDAMMSKKHQHNNRKFTFHHGHPSPIPQIPVVNVNKKRTGKSTHAMKMGRVNPQFRLGHFLCRKLLVDQRVSHLFWPSSFWAHPGDWRCARSMSSKKLMARGQWLAAMATL